MKKKMKHVLFVLAAVMLPCMVVSCGEDPVVPETPPGIENPDDPQTPSDIEPANTVWAPEKQKMYLEDVALELNAKMPVEDFRHYIELANYVYNQHEDDDWDNVGDWAEDILDGLMIDLHHTEREEESYNSYYYSYVQTNIYSCYKSTILASNFLGRWESRNGKWTYSPADDLQFTFKNKSQQDCVLRLKTSGNVAKVHLFDLDDWQDDDPTKEINGTYYYTDYYDRTAYTIGVPERIEVTLTEGSTELVSQTIVTDLSSITSEEFDLSRSTLTFSSTTKFNNGYTINVENIKYNATGTSGRTTLVKNNETLLSATFSSDLKNVPKKTLTDWYNMDDDEIEKVLENTTNSNGAFSLNILGKIQVKGILNDVHKLVDALDEAYDNDEDEKAFKSALDKANSCFDVTIYYNGGIAKQAYMTLTPFFEDSWYSSWWDAECTINFPDGTSYSFDEYFNEDDFKDLIDAIEDQGDDAEDMWD